MEQSAGQRSSVATNATVDLEVLDCTVCCHPLKPPVLQCGVGHVICSSCHGKLPDKNRCHVCAMDTAYNRCFAVEQILRSILVPCRNAGYGCDAKTAYHDSDSHEDGCPHAPCFCPELGCGFAGATSSLPAHFTGGHGWPLATEFRRARAFDLQVQEGKRVLRDVDGGHLFLVDVAPAGPAGLAGAVLLLDPHAGAKVKPKFECHVAFHCRATGWRSSSEFPVRSTALAGGSLPADCYAFVVPRVAHPPATASIIVSVYDVSKKRPRNGDIRQHLKSRVN
uniref:RING-type E3 ubiquitin transferase n=1 Tax=Oryza glumipatula TaxID=40148 RepID=A0A0D9YFA5_9ORYZ